VGDRGSQGSFRGRFFLSIDAKGRVNVPSAFRQVLEERYGDPRLVLATPFDRCVNVYPLKEWEEIEARAAQMPPTKQNVKIYFRHFIGSAVECECDRQGRILLPPSHKDWARIDGGQVTFLGQITKMEIWNRAALDQSMAEQDLSSVEEEITQLGGRI